MTINNFNKTNKKRRFLSRKGYVLIILFFFLLGSIVVNVLFTPVSYSSTIVHSQLNYEYGELDLLLKEEILREADNIHLSERPFRMRFYRVKKGDTLKSIARRFGIKVSTIKSVNRLKNNRIHKGQRLKIPTMNGILYKVKRGDNLTKIAKRFKVSLKKLMKVNKENIYAGRYIFVPDAKYYFTMKKISFIMPYNGKITSGFGYRHDPFHKNRIQFHEGIDIACYNKPVKAAYSGVVVYAGALGGYGNTVILAHRKKYRTLYAHNKRLLVHKGQFVRQGQAISICGSTGYSTGGHIHFEIIHNRKYLNPLSLAKR